MTEQFELPRGTEVAKINCPDCGGVIRVKIQKDQRAYATCLHASEKGYRCGYKSTFGEARSRNLRREYLEKPQKTGLPPADPPKRQPAKAKTPPAPAPAPAPKPKTGEYDEYGI